MKRLLVVLTLVVFGTLAAAGTCLAKGPSEILRVDNLTDLVEKARELDGQSISFSGEAFGDKMVRKDGTWINIGDPATIVIGVFAPQAVAQDVTHLGRHGIRGDIVTAVGEFHRACAEHGGDMDVHAMLIRVDKTGGPVDEPLKTALAWWSAGLLAVSGGLYMEYVRKTKRQQA